MAKLNFRLYEVQEQEDSVGFEKLEEPIRTPEDQQKRGKMLEDDPEIVPRSEGEDRMEQSAEEPNNVILQVIGFDSHPPPRDTSSNRDHLLSRRLFPPETTYSDLGDVTRESTPDLDSRLESVQEALGDESENLPLLPPSEPKHSLRKRVSRVISRITRPRVAPNQRRITWFCVSCFSLCSYPFTEFSLQKAFFSSVQVNL
jgi:hypothetical protein